MQRFFLSGGSSGVPKLVNINSFEWYYSILDTASVLKQLGVGIGDSILIAQPSFPWSIGEVFSNASIFCGANAICFGLHSDNESVFKYWNELKPKFIIAPPSLLLKMSQYSKNISRINIIAVGEYLNYKNENRLKKIYNTDFIRRIYGLSEFGTIGYQYSDKSNLLCLNPRFNYKILPIEPINERNNNNDKIGMLVIESKYENKIIETKDIVKIQPNNLLNVLWNNTYVIEFLRRSDLMITLFDGSHITEQIIDILIENLKIEELQFIYYNRSHRIELKYKSKSNIPSKRFKNNVIKVIPEIQDLINDNKVQLITTRVSKFEFYTTLRGKFIRLVSLNK